MKRENIIKYSFDIISTEQKKRHTSQIMYILKYLEKMNIKKSTLLFLKKILTLEENIFWCIDDTLDKEYQNNSEMNIYNEIVKFVSSIRLFEQILDYQLKEKKDFIGLLFGKKITSQKIILSINKNLNDLVNIPYNERKQKSIILNKLNKENNNLKKMIVNYQINRAQNIKIYIGTAESITGIQIKKDPFIFLRALQLLKEDMIEKRKDYTKNNANIINILNKKIKNKKTIRNIILNSADYLIEKVRLSTDKKTNFLNNIANKEKENILAIYRKI